MSPPAPPEICRPPRPRSLSRLWEVAFPILSGAMTRRCRLIIVGLVLLAYLPPLLDHWQQSRSSARTTFLELSSAPATAAGGSFEAELIAPDPAIPTVHVASVCEAPDGLLCAAWYGGTHEGARDVNIYWSKRRPGHG